MKKRPSEFFLELARLGPVPHGREDATYGTLLSEAGFSRRPGAWTLREEAPVVLAAHLDTVTGRAPRGVRVVDGVAQGIEGALGADDKAGVALVLALAQDPPPGVGFALFLGEDGGSSKRASWRWPWSTFWRTTRISWTSWRTSSYPGEG